MNMTMPQFGNQWTNIFDEAGKNFPEGSFPNALVSGSKPPEQITASAVNLLAHRLDQVEQRLKHVASSTGTQNWLA